jgi:hypothetical protein
MPWRKDKSSSASTPSRNVNEIITIGGSGARNKNKSKHSQFERLDESVLRDEDLQPDHGVGLTTSMYHGDGARREDVESQGSGDEIPLKAIQKRMDVDGVSREHKLDLKRFPDY